MDLGYDLINISTHILLQTQGFLVQNIFFAFFLNAIFSFSYPLYFLISRQKPIARPI